MPLDPLAERGFGSTLASAWEYELGRPGYPHAAVAALANALLLDKDSRVLDLAAGTGQLSRLFVPLVGSVVAVEPSAAMRDVFVRRVSGVEVLAGRAEQLPLDAASVDAIVIGNAFHWFDGDLAIREVWRVLRPGGGLAVCWNTGLATDPATPRLEQLVDDLRARHLPQARRSDTDAWRRSIEKATELFEPLNSIEVMHERGLDQDTFTAYIASLSFMSALPDAERSVVLHEVRRLAPRNCVLTMRCECCWTRRLSQG